MAEALPPKSYQKKEEDGEARPRAKESNRVCHEDALARRVNVFVRGLVDVAGVYPRRRAIHEAAAEERPLLWLRRGCSGDAHYDGADIAANEPHRTAVVLQLRAVQTYAAEMDENDWAREEPLTVAKPYILVSVLLVNGRRRQVFAVDFKDILRGDVGCRL